MIGGEHEVSISVPSEQVWDFMADFANWAPFVIGFQRFEQIDRSQSVWTLRGDVGMLARDVEIRVDLIDEVPGHRAAFELTGITERLSGQGSFEVLDAASIPDSDPASGPGLAGAPDSSSPGSEGSWWSRFTRAVARRLIRRAKRRAAARDGASNGAATSAAESASSTAGAHEGALTSLTFRIEVEPQGPMKPMLEMLMEPLLEPAAEDLSTSIKQEMESARA